MIIWCEKDQEEIDTSECCDCPYPDENGDCAYESND